VDQAKHVFHNRGGIELDGRITFIDFATNRKAEAHEGVNVNYNILKYLLVNRLTIF